MHLPLKYICLTLIMMYFILKNRLHESRYRYLHILMENLKYQYKDEYKKIWNLYCYQIKHRYNYISLIKY